MRHAELVKSVARACPGGRASDPRTRCSAPDPAHAFGRVTADLPPRRHALEHAVASDQAVEERRAEMGEEGGEQQVGEIGVQEPQPRVEYLVMREDRRETQRTQQPEPVTPPP